MNPLAAHSPPPPGDGLQVVCKHWAITVPSSLSAQPSTIRIHSSSSSGFCTRNRALNSVRLVSVNCGFVARPLAWERHYF